MTLFHPFELAFCGYSGSGKTTLVTSLLEAFGNSRQIGYVKHDAHRFDMDRPGKDTYRAKESGATDVFICDSDHHAYQGSGELDRAMAPVLFENCEWVFIEGYKKKLVHKVLLLDEENKAWQAYQQGEFPEVVALVGTADSSPDPSLPYFHRDDIVAIKQFVIEHMTERVSSTPIFGLVLAGGKSTRMGQDKASLEYHGQPQVERVFQSLSKHCQQTFLSTRENQWQDGRFDKLPQITDRFLGFGPLGGILSAMETHPEAAWMVVGCDLPFVDENSVNSLVKGRQVFRLATAFTSPVDGWPEPVFALYEPRAKGRLMRFLSMGYTCPRKALINSDIGLIQAERPEWLRNVNHPHEFEQAKQELSGV